MKAEFDRVPIDRNWGNWKDIVVEYNGVTLGCEKVAITAGDDAEGAMIVSTSPIACVADPGKECLSLERLCTAPRNRAELRQDETDQLAGIGIELLRLAAWLSRELGLGGRLRLDASPDSVAWYEKRGLKTLALERILFEGVEYTPMELSEAETAKLLESWDS